jgi:tRNA-dihydrouridine synthase 4
MKIIKTKRLQFRELIRKYECELAYTPMIMSDSFVQSQKARDCEFTTNKTDRPLIVQFAANNVDHFATATQFVRNECDGVELNCGCPQKWAIQEGVGVALIDKSELVCEIVKETRKRLDYDPEFTVAVKIRIHEDIK